MMSSNQFSEAWNGIENGWQAGQLAHAYLIQGPVEGTALRFADRLLNLIFNNHPQIATRSHPDLIWIEPQSKSRQITINEVRELIRRLSQTSFSGGWKAGVLLCADRMNEQSANALLKTLEEPPEKSILLLITEEPQALLPTISSRCQRISLTDEADLKRHAWEDELLDLLGELPPASLPEASLLTGRLSGILSGLKKEYEEEENARLPEEMSSKEAKGLLEARSSARLVAARTEMLRMIQLWHRDLLFLVLEQNETLLRFQDDLEKLRKQAVLCSRADVLRRIAAVDEMARQFERNLPEGLVFNSFFTALI